MGASFQKAQGKGNTAALGVMLLACAGGAVLAGGLAGAAMVAAALACTAYVAVMAKREFGGMSGDLDSSCSFANLPCPCAWWWLRR